MSGWSERGEIDAARQRRRATRGRERATGMLEQGEPAVGARADETKTLDRGGWM